MAIGDQDDITSRLDALVPNGWFAAGAAVVHRAILAGAANALAFVFSMLTYLRQQSRLATMSDGFLDMFAADFFGANLPRLEAQSDASYRARIVANLFRERGTRNSVRQVLLQLTGREPIIFEPRRPADTGGYGLAGGYGVAGGYGSMLLPMQSFVTALRPQGVGVPSVAGYGSPAGGYGTPSRADYASLGQLLGNVTDADIVAAIESVRPATYTIWVRVTS